jgi:CheY-like chemotaxis protein
MANILVADDSKEVRERLTQKLSEAGHTVDAAIDGVDALEKAKATAPDLLIVDCFMPQSGIEVIQAIRQDPEYAAIKGLPIIGITDMAGEGEIRHFTDLGANKAWEKRLDNEVGIPSLLKLIDEVLG